MTHPVGVASASVAARHAAFSASAVHEAGHATAVLASGVEVVKIQCGVSYRDGVAEPAGAVWSVLGGVPAGLCLDLVEAKRLPARCLANHVLWTALAGVGGAAAEAAWQDQALSPEGLYRFASPEDLAQAQRAVLPFCGSVCEADQLVRQVWEIGAPWLVSGSRWAITSALACAIIERCEPVVTLDGEAVSSILADALNLSLEAPADRRVHCFERAPDPLADLADDLSRRPLRRWRPSMTPDPQRPPGARPDA